MENNFTLRAYRDEDIPFIYNSWLKSYRDAPSMATIPNTLYYAGQHGLIETLLERSHVVVACSSEDPSQIMGYIVYEAPRPDSSVIHWAYVKHPFRNFGVAKALEGAATANRTNVRYTHRVKVCERLLRTRPYTYDPFLVMQVKK